MNILFCGYRDWSLDVFKHLEEEFNEYIFFAAKSKEQFLEYSKCNIKFDLIFFVGWSSILDSRI